MNGIDLKQKNLKNLLNLIENKKRYVFLTCLCNLIGSVCYNIVLAVVMQKVLDGIALQDISYLIQGMAIAFTAFLIAFVGEPIFARKRNYQIRSTIANIRRNIFETIVEMNVAEYEKRNHGELYTQLTNDVEKLEDGYFVHIPNYYFAWIHGGIAVLLILFYDFRLGILSLFLGGIQSYLNCGISDKIEVESQQRQKSRDRIIQKIEDMQEGKVDIKLLSAEKYFEKLFSKDNLNLKGWEKGIEKKKLLVKVLNQIFENLNTIVIMGLGLYMVLIQEITLGAVVAIISLQGNAIYLFQNLSLFVAGIADIMPSANRIIELINYNNQMQITEKTCTEEKRDITDLAVFMENISFDYKSERNLLCGFSISVKKGELAVIFGESGKGKSTWIKLALGMYDSWEGEYYLFGRDMKTKDRDFVRENIAYVDQECYLFHMTVKENIRLGNMSASDEDIIRACKEANAHDFIMRLQEGYDTILTNGKNLSGGQKQRIALARAFVSQKPILLIDEGTSNLDLESEQEILGTISRLKKTRTIVAVSHREAWKEIADRIYYLK